jgi:Domain of unknown function (DUF4335)
MPVLTRPISRIYTPPTCTLEVTAQPSALSRWTGTPAIKSLQFLLSFEGLSQGDRDPIELRGDQTQLADLSAAVTDYIQRLLSSPANELPIRPDNDRPDNIPGEIPPPSVPSAASVQIRPRSLLTHELTLGSLANERSGASLVLKVSQLYDLATALDDSAADLQHIPALTVASNPWQTVLPLARSAAVVLLTVGLGTAAWRLSQPSMVAVNESKRSPDSITALAPPASPLANKALPSLRPRPSAPLTLPSIKLPSRSSSSVASSGSANSVRENSTRENSDLLASSQQPLVKPSSRPDLSQSSAQKLSGEDAIAPAPAPAMKSAPPTAPLANSQADSVASRGAFAESRAMPQAPEAVPNARSNVGQSSLFDTIGQVAEVRDYVASRWQPTSPPPRTLEYRLTLNPDGSLAQVDPLGASAQQYLGQLPLPAPKSPFVSAIASGGKPTVRLVLSPDGTVKTFLDGTSR